MIYKCLEKMCNIFLFETIFSYTKLRMSNIEYNISLIRSTFPDAHENKCIHLVRLATF